MTRRRISPSAARAQINFIKTILDDCSRDWPKFTALIDDALAGYTSCTLGSGGGAGGDISDPTSRLALQPDAAAEVHERLVRDVATLVAVAQDLDQVRTAWTPLAVATNLCRNRWGCPVGKHAAKGRGGRCSGCAEFKRRTGDDRTSARLLDVAG